MKRYDQDFKTEALKLSDDIGVKKACEQLNVNYGTLAGWRKRRAKKNKEKKNADGDIQKENSRLKKEIAELKNANDILKDALTFFRSRPEEIENGDMFAYIHCRADEKKFSARMMCAVLPVSESGFYKWKRNRGKVKAWQKLLAEMHKILDEDEENKNYGVRRMQIALEQRGIRRSLSTIRRVMARGNLLHEDRRSPDGLTKADKKAMRPQNIIKQDFSAQAPLRKLLTDITQIPCKDGKLYVSPLLDCYNGEIIALAMDTNMKKELCIKTITEAYKNFDIKDGAIIHSDAGSQYTSSEYKKILGQLHAVQSMSGVGKCWDNARMESWFATLKKEKVYQLDTTKLTVEKVKTIVWRYTFAYYNTKRVTTVNPDGLPPVVYREKTASKKGVA